MSWESIKYEILKDADNKELQDLKISNAKLETENKNFAQMLEKFES